MKAKIKARELVIEFYNVDAESNEYGMEWQMAKQCALIDIQNRIDLLNEVSFIIDGYGGYFQRILNELQEVKTEIQNL